jgi:hypothetical protein
MGRINPNDVDKYGSNNSSEWLKLQNDGDVARVQFLYRDYSEMDFYNCHKVKVGEFDRYVSCAREDYDSPVEDCPFCLAGMKTSVVCMIAMYDLNDNKIKIWERGKTFSKKLSALFNRYPDLINHVFEIERHGAKGDKKTTYDIYPMPDVTPVDLTNIEKPEFLGGFIMEKSADDMQFYIDNGAFPDEEKSDGSEPVRRRSAESETPSRRSSRRVG